MLTFFFVYFQKNLHESCYFYETLENGWFQYRSAMNEKIFLGFTTNGRPVRHKAPHLNTDCYNFQKMDSVQNKTVKSHKTQTSCRKKGQPKKLQDQQQRQNVRRRHGGHAAKRLNNSNNSNSQTNVKELDLQSYTDYTYEDYLNMAKKQKAIPKKVTTSNNGMLPKIRHGHRRNNKGGNNQWHKSIVKPWVRTVRENGNWICTKKKSNPGSPSVSFCPFSTEVFRTLGRNGYQFSKWGSLHSVHVNSSLHEAPCVRGKVKIPREICLTDFKRVIESGWCRPKTTIVSRVPLLHFVFFLRVFYRQNVKKAKKK